MLTAYTPPPQSAGRGGWWKQPAGVAFVIFVTSVLIIIHNSLDGGERTCVTGVKRERGCSGRVIGDGWRAAVFSVLSSGVSVPIRLSLSLAMFHDPPLHVQPVHVAPLQSPRR